MIPTWLPGTTDVCDITGWPSRARGKTMPKVTKKLREQWAQQREQAIEERTVDQSGRLRDADSVAEMDETIALMDHLLSLPIGATF
jgi:hypothetical protein